MVGQVVTLFNLEGTREGRERRDTRGYSSAGRAPALQAGGRRFDPDYLHHLLSFEKESKQRKLLIQPRQETTTGP